MLIDKNENNLTLNKFNGRGNQIYSETLDALSGEEKGMARKQFRIILRGDRCEIFIDDRRKFNTLMDSRNYIFSAILIKQNHTKWEQS